MIDNLTLNAYTFSSPNGYTTQGAYAVGDIGDSSSNGYLDLTLIGIGFNFIDIMAYDMFSVRPQ